MRYFYDCEFVDTGSTIELISLAMVAEDGREFYGANIYAPWHAIIEHEWLKANVLPSLPMVEDHECLICGPMLVPDHANRLWTDTEGIAQGVLDLIGTDDDAQLWAYYAAYDHVALAQLWGPMMKLPPRVPMWTHDLKQEMEYRGVTKLPEQAAGEHNALADARWNRDSFLWLQQQPTVTER